MPNVLVRDGAALHIPVRTDLDGWHFRLRLALRTNRCSDAPVGGT
jgi:hypothetical protein